MPSAAKVERSLSCLFDDAHDVWAVVHRLYKGRINRRAKAVRKRLEAIEAKVLLTSDHHHGVLDHSSANSFDDAVVSMYEIDIGDVGAKCRGRRANFHAVSLARLGSRRTTD